MPGLTPILPLSLDRKDGYKLISNMPGVVKQNLKNLFLTNPGERIMDPEFGIGIKKYLFEQNTATTHDILRTSANKQIKKYMPFLKINDIQIMRDSENDNIMYIKVLYIISPLNQTDFMDLAIKN